MLIYGGSAYAYANDVEFKGVSTSEKFWDEVITKFYTKYNGLQRWHQKICTQVRQTGRLEVPSGRIYTFTPEQSYKGLKWPDTKIKNYPCQGFGADLVLLARLHAYHAVQRAGLQDEVLFVCTVHDSIVVDTPSKHVDTVAKILYNAVAAIPAQCERLFGYTIGVPMTSEVHVGPTKGNMDEYKFT